MNIKNIILPTIALGLALSSVAHAENSKTLIGDAELGWTATGGNTDSTNTKARLDIKHNTKNWKHNYVFEGYGSSSDVLTTDATTGEITKASQTNAEKYSATIRNGLKINEEHASLFVQSSYEHDRFSGFIYQGSISAGYANRLFTSDNANLNYRVGPGYAVAKAELTDGGIVYNDKEETFIVLVDLTYQRKLSANAKFSQQLTSNISGDSKKNTRTQSITSVSANLSNAFALKASYTINYNDIVPKDKKHANTLSSVTLVYSF